MLIDDFKQQKLMVVVFGTSMHVYFKQEKLNTIFTDLVFSILIYVYSYSKNQVFIF